MKEFFASKSFKTLVATVIIIIAVSVITAFDNSVLSSALNFITSPMQGVAADAANNAVKKSYEELESENEALKKENADLRSRVVDYYDVKQENQRLWKYYGLKSENPEYELLPASVIRRDPNDDFYSFTANKGTASGVSVNDIVVTENGLVGWVYQADASSCKIKTILSPQTKAGAIDKETRDSGIITGSALYCDDNLTTLTKISASNKIKEGDIIVTTGIGGFYPENIVVGKVKRLSYDSYDTSLYAIIEPYEDIRTVSDIVIITDFAGKGEVLTKTQDASQPTTVSVETDSVFKKDEGDSY